MDRFLALERLAKGLRKKVRRLEARQARHGQGKRVAVRDFAELANCMERKATAAGFAIEPGTLRATDPGALKSAFQNGLGSAKAFGCGLLVLAPISTGD